MHCDMQLLVPHLALDDGGEQTSMLFASLLSHLGASAHDLRPCAFGRGGVVAVVVLVGGDDELAAGLLQQRTP